MRFIPKKSKVYANIYKNFSVIDALVILCGLIVEALIVFSNLEIKWGLALGWAGFVVILMLGDADDKTYLDIINMIRYAASRKTFSIDAKRGNVDDVIPFLDIDDNGVIEYGAYVGAVLEVGTVEFGLLEEYEQNRRITAFARGLNGINPTTVVQLVKIDRPVHYDEIAAQLLQKLEAARAENPVDAAKVAILESRLGQIDMLNNVETQYCPFYYLVVYENTREDLEKVVGVLYDGVRGAELECRMLDNVVDVAVFFKYCYTRNFDEREVYDFYGTPGEYVRPEKIRFKAGSVEADGVYSFTYAVSDYPLTVGNAWGAELFNIDNTKVVLTLKPVDRTKAVKRIDNAISEISTRQSGKMSKALAEETHIETMGELLIGLQNENESLFDVTLTVTGYNNTKEENAAFRKDVRRRIVTGGFKVNALRGRQYDGFVTSAVTRKTALKRFERGINSESLAAVFPFVFTSILDAEGVMLGYDSYPVLLDIWKRNDYYNNSNIVVIGKSGAGKSFFTSSLITSLYSDNVHAFVFDPENEYNVLCRNIGGKFIDVGNASEGRINPLQIYQILTDDGAYASPESVYSSQLRFLEDFFRITLPGITSDSLEELNNLVGDLYASCGITTETDCSNFLPSQFPTFDKFLTLVESELKHERSHSRIENLTRVKTYLEKFATGGRYAQLWNGESTLTSDEHFVVFNFQSLFESKNPTVSNAQMLVFLRFLEQKIINIRELNRAGAAIHPLVVIDEGYNFIDPAYPVALDFIRSWFKRIRKYNGSMMFLTQNLSDILGNAEIVSKTSAIINNSQYSFIFALAPQDIVALTELYALSGGINETERQAISSARRGDCFAVLSSVQRATFHVDTNPTIVSMFSDKNALARPRADIEADVAPQDDSPLSTQ